jgi:hypothetical protein
MWCQSERRANQSWDSTIPVPMSLDDRKRQPPATGVETQPKRAFSSPAQAALSRLPIFPKDVVSSAQHEMFSVLIEPSYGWHPPVAAGPYRA